MMVFKKVILAALVAVMAAPGLARAEQGDAGWRFFDELVVGVGLDDVLKQDGTRQVAGLVEFRTGEIVSIGPVDLRGGGAFEFDGDGDIWVGAGVVATADVTDRWRLEGSFMPGGYANGEHGTDLGHTVEFRSQIGVSYRVTDRLRAGAAFEHKSNAGMGSSNGGVETLFATLGWLL